MNSNPSTTRPSERRNSTGPEGSEWRKILAELGTNAPHDVTPLEQNSAPACPICGDLGYVTHPVAVDHPDFGKAFPCACQAPLIAQKRIDRALKDSYLLDEYRGCTFETLATWAEGDLAGKEGAIAACRQMCDGGWPVVDGVELPGVVLCGKLGVGKTGLAALVVFHWLAAGRSALAIHWNDFTDQVQDSYGRQKAEGPSADEKVRIASEVDLLVIDELGSLRHVQTDDQVKIFEKLFRPRHARRLPTILTTNLGPDAIRAQFGPYVFERIAQRCHWLMVGGRSLRLIRE